MDGEDTGIGKEVETSTTQVGERFHGEVSKAKGMGFDAPSVPRDETYGETKASSRSEWRGNP